MFTRIKLCRSLRPLLVGESTKPAGIDFYNDKFTLEQNQRWFKKKHKGEAKEVIRRCEGEWGHYNWSRRSDWEEERDQQRHESDECESPERSEAGAGESRQGDRYERRSGSRIGQRGVWTGVQM